MKIENAVALVTGANRGIGLAFARELLERGARKVYAAARDPVTVTQSGVHALRLDVNKPEDVDAAAELASDVTLVINNAGVAQPGGFLAADSEVARHLCRTNFFAMLRMSKAFAPILRGNGGGALLNVLSVTAWASGGELAAQSASKSPAWSLTNALRNELAVQKTQVLALHMAYVDADDARGIDIPKSSPQEIVRCALDGLESGLDEVLADELSLQVKRGMTAASRSSKGPNALRTFRHTLDSTRQGISSILL